MQRLCSLFATIIPFLILNIVIAAEPNQPAFDPGRFEVTSLVRGLKQPMELAITPDGTILLIELDGKLKSVNPKTHEVKVVGDLKVTLMQENGLIGLAIDPHFAQNSWIYLQYSPPEFSGQHISRFTLVDGVLDPSSEKLLFKFEEQRKECCHHAGSLHFGPAGDLYIGTGDNTNPFGDSLGYAAIDERPDKAPWDAQKSSANTNSYNGKILRIKPTAEGSYTIPDGNLFPRDGSKGRPEIYVMGCRNPWRINVDSETGFLYWGDVGPDAGADGPRGPRGHDEINQARVAGNFGWPYFVANNKAYHDVDFETGVIGETFNPLAPVNDSPNNTGEKILPPAQTAFIFYPGADSPEFPEVGRGGRTACAGPVYHYSESLPSNVKFPAAFDGVLFIYEWSRHWIKAVRLDEDFHLREIAPFMAEHQFIRPIDMEFGPDGAMYLLEYGDTWGINQNARLVRIDYVAGNRTPVVIASAENNVGKQPLAVSLLSKGTFDKDEGDKLSYEWRVSRAVESKDPSSTVSATATASKVMSHELNPTIIFDQPGIYNVELVVTDPHGASKSASLPVLVGNERPSVRFVEPQVGDFFEPEQPIRYELTVNDVEDGTNDDHEVEVQGLDRLIDANAPQRVSVNAVFSNEPIPSADGKGEIDQGPAGMQRMKRSDCFNCHAVDQKRVGPMLLEIATKYRGKEGALDASIQRVLKGSIGAWGKVPMIPHSQHTPDEVREMVAWIYSLEPAGLLRVFPGFTGEIAVATDEGKKPGHYKLEASYVDRGAGELPALSATATIYLRSRLAEAELADEVHGPTVMDSGSASGKKCVGSISHGHFLRYNRVSLDRVKQITVKVTSAGAGGAIEVHLDKPDGETLATIPVEVNGAWDKFYESTVEIPETKGRHDVYFVFAHPKKVGGLMNVDSIYFSR